MVNGVRWNALTLRIPHLNTPDEYCTRKGGGQGQHRKNQSLDPPTMACPNPGLPLALGAPRLRESAYCPAALDSAQPAELT
jgi:hypothetical protein